MTVSSTSPFDQTPARRPGLYTDVINGDKSDDSAKPVTAPDEIGAAEFTVIGKLVHGACGSISTLRVAISNNGTAVAVAGILCPSSVIDATSFTCARTGTGVTTIDIAQALIPTPILPPTARSISASATTVPSVVQSVSGSNYRFTVTTYNASGSATDMNYILEVA